MIYRPSLNHQRPQEQNKKVYDGINAWYKRGEGTGTNVRKFRKGACENCGSMTHKKKDCLEVLGMLVAMVTSCIHRDHVKLVQSLTIRTSKRMRGCNRALTSATMERGTGRDCCFIVF